MIEGHGKVNQGLQEETVRALHRGPQFFQDFVTLEERAGAI
jgi:hypothetical protein